MKEFRINDACPALPAEDRVEPAKPDGRRKRVDGPDVSPCRCPLCRGRMSIVQGRLGPMFVCDCERAA